MLGKKRPAGIVKFLNHNFFLLAQNNNQEISALTCEKN